jgi:glycosyltransferase involved in cell wall biosynthesis
VTTTASIIICTAGKPESLSETLRSLEKLTIPADIVVELLVVDNQPTTAKTATDNCSINNMTVKYVEEPSRGQSYARNCGLRFATGEIIIFTDDDLQFSTTWIQDLIEPIITGKSDAVAGAIRMAPELERDWMTNYHRVCYAELTDPIGGYFEMVGANMAFHRRVLKQVPVFDVRLGPGALGFCDDSLFSVRLRDAGYKIVFNKDAEVTHHFSDDRLKGKALRRHAEQLGRSVGFVARHWEQKQITAPHLRRLRKALQLSLRRLTSPKGSPEDEGCDEGELFDIKGWAFIDQYIKESSKPAFYNRPITQSARRNSIVAIISDLFHRVPS